MIEGLLKQVANQLDSIGMTKQASEVDAILVEFRQKTAAPADLFNDVDLVLKHFGERGLKKAWREDHIYKTSSISVIEKKKQEYLREYKEKHS